MDNFSLFNIFEDNEITEGIDQQVTTATPQTYYHSDEYPIGVDKENEHKLEEQRRSSLMSQIVTKERHLAINRNMQMLIRQQLELVTSLITPEAKDDNENVVNEFLSSFPSESSSYFFSRQRKNYPRFVSSGGKVLSLMDIKPLSIKRWTKKSDTELSALVLSQCQQLLKFESVPSEEIENCRRYNKSTNETEKSQILHDMIPVLISHFSWESISSELGHSCADCFVHWLNSCDPFINTGPWELEEDASLSSIALQRGYRDWRAIACELGTNRTPYQCYERFVRVLELEDYNRKWSEEEDQAVLEGVKRYGTKNWSKVAHLVKTKQWMQCRSRYFQSLRFQGKKGRWGYFETNKLLLLLFFYGWKDWTWIAQDMITRNVAQCRDRWTNILHPDVSSKPWSREEEALFRQLTNGQTRIVWKELCKYFPGRTADTCKSHFKSCIE